MNQDPVRKAEQITKDIHDELDQYTKRTRARYPLLFSFFAVFSVSAIVHGVELLIDQVPLFNTHPMLLIGIGTFALFITGSLYKSLQNIK